jgi:hypothetical protein
MRTAFRALTGVVFLLLSFPAWPAAHAPRQDSTLLSLTGKVRDAQTGGGIAYAAVGIPGTPVGTVSDTSGRFSLRVPVKYSGDTLLVSLLGYAPHRALIRTLPAGQPLAIGLEQKNHSLREAVVEARRLTGRDILGLAIERLPVTYPAAPYTAEGFYRETRFKDGRYKSLLEAAVQLYNLHNRPFVGIGISRRVAIAQIRSSRAAGQYAFPDYNALYTLLYAEFIRMRSFERLDKRVPRAYPSLLDTLNARPVYVILVENAPHLTRLFIDAENYGVARVEDYRTFAGPADGKLSNQFWLRYIGVVNGYEYREGKYYLNYLSVHAEGEKAQPGHGEGRSGGRFVQRTVHSQRLRRQPPPGDARGRHAPVYAADRATQALRSRFLERVLGACRAPGQPAGRGGPGGTSRFAKAVYGIVALSTVTSGRIPPAHDPTVKTACPNVFLMPSPRFQPWEPVPVGSQRF